MSAYSDAVLADSPDVYYRLSETGAGPFVDLVAARNATPNTTIVSVASLLAADANAGAYFDWNTGCFKGTSAYTLSNQPLTVEAWVKPSALTSFGGAGYTCIASCMAVGTGWICGYTTSGAWKFTTAGVTDYVFTAAAVVSTIYHVVFVLQSDNSVDLYLNGAFSQKITSGSPMVATAGTLMIGDLSAGSTHPYPQATYDELAVYKAALSPGRIYAHWLTGISVTPFANVTITA